MSKLLCNLFCRKSIPKIIRACSLIRNEKPIIPFEKNCCATEKSKATACVKRCRSSQLTGWWTQKEESEKWRALEAQRVADPKK
jgi:hypothetical protein